MSFFQRGPTLGNQYVEDPALRQHLRRVLPKEVHAAVEPDLERFGARVAGDVLALADTANADEPRLVQFDPWGRRIDRIVPAHGWTQLERVAAEEGIVALAYERRHGAYSRLHQLAKLYLFDPSSAIYSCPLAMTDGAARLIEVHGDAALKAGAFKHLTSRDPETFWTSGQWMTERTGGSDVAGTGTIAKPAADGSYRLFGDKWFTSATTSQMAMTLAYIDGEDRLSLFYLETRRPDGDLNGIRIHRLKDKLGTCALPTAELTLDGTVAKRVGPSGSGVKCMSTLFNVTRIYNAACATGSMRRAVNLARAYARERRAFGKRLDEHPLHLGTLAALEVEARAGTHFVFSLAERLGRVECGAASAEDQALLRLLTPVVKLFTAKQAIAVASETLECFGGAGYIEDTGLPRLLRDAQVLAIWEGTTNVLSLDMLRAINKEEALPAFYAAVRSMLGGAQSLDAARRVGAALVELEAVRPTEEGARAFAMALGRIYAGAALCQQAAFDGTEAALLAAQRWCRQDLAKVREIEAAAQAGRERDILGAHPA